MGDHAQCAFAGSHHGTSCFRHGSISALGGGRWGLRRRPCQVGYAGGTAEERGPSDPEGLENGASRGQPRTYGSSSSPRHCVAMVDTILRTMGGPGADRSSTKVARIAAADSQNRTEAPSGRSLRSGGSTHRSGPGLSRNRSRTFEAHGALRGRPVESVTGGSDPSFSLQGRDLPGVRTSHPRLRPEPQRAQDTLLRPSPTCSRFGGGRPAIDREGTPLASVSDRPDREGLMYHL